MEVKDVRVPEQLQRAMAAEAEAAREARAKVIAAEGEHKASRALRQAAEVIVDSPAALQVFNPPGRGKCDFVTKLRSSDIFKHSAASRRRTTAP